MGSDKVGEEFWENKWSKTPFTRFSWLDKYLAINKKLDSTFKKFLRRDENKNILEIGCAEGKKLIYFAKEFGYNIYGIDYSKEGVKNALKNLELSNVKGTLICENVFKTSLKNESFDIVYSMGLIEHFGDPEEIIDIHIQLTKKNGILIITIPNFNNNLYYSLRKIFGKEKELLESHNLEIMDKGVFYEKIKNKNNIEIHYFDYLGPIDLSLVFGDMSLSRNLSLIVNIINQFIGYLTFYMPKSGYLSPYIVLIAEKIS